MDIVRDMTAASGTLHVIEGARGYSIAVVNEWYGRGAARCGQRMVGRLGLGCQGIPATLWVEDEVGGRPPPQPGLPVQPWAGRILPSHPHPGEMAGTCTWGSATDGS